MMKILLFFPSVTFGIYSAEVFPYALIFSIFHMKKIDRVVLIIMFMLCVNILFQFDMQKESMLYDIARSLFAYLNSFLIFYVITNNLTERSLNSLRRVTVGIFITMTLLAVAQYYHVLSGLDFIFKALVPRSSATDLAFMNRGVTLLSTEPARAGIEYLFIYFFVRRFYIPNSCLYICDILILLMVLFVFKSATVLALFVIFYVFINISFFIHYSFFLIILVLLYLTYSPELNPNSGRVLTLISTIINLPAAEAFYYVVNTSGHRIISIYSSILFGFNYPFGGGIGNWVVSSQRAIELTGLDYKTMNYFVKSWDLNGNYAYRSSGFIMNLMVDVGIVGVLSFLYALFKYTRRCVNWSRLEQQDKGFLFVFLINAFFIGSVGAPVAWVISALYLREVGNGQKV